MPKKFGFAIFGSGRMGSTHFKNVLLNERATLRYLVEESVDKAYELLDRYDMRQSVQVVGLQDVNQVFQDQSVDAVIIATPPSTHEKLVTDALKADKSVFCEKPLALSIEATKACYDAAAEAKLPLFCAFNRRFEPQLRLLHDRVRAGEIGRVRSLRSTSRDTPQMMNPAYLAVSGGIFLDSCVHDIDMLNWLVGETPVTVYTDGHAGAQMYRNCGDVDTCLILLKYPGGAIGTVEVSREAPVGNDTRVEVFGSEGLLKSENRRMMNLQHETMQGTHSSPIYAEGIHRYWESYQAELQHFIQVLEGSAQLDVTRDSTVTVNIIAEACKESLRTGGVINLAQFSQKYL